MDDFSLSTRVYRCNVCDGEYRTLQHLSSHMTRSHRALGSARDLIDNFSSVIRGEESTQTAIIQSFPPMAVEENEMEEGGNSLPILSSQAASLDAPLAVHAAYELPVAADVEAFYSCFPDHSTEIHSGLPQLHPKFSALHKSCFALIEFVTLKKQTVPEMESVWRLISSLEQNIPEECRHVTREFSSSRSFATFVDRARKWKAKNQGWRSALIKTTLGANSTGVFRSTLELLIAELNSSGGLRSVIPYREAVKDGKRVFQGPCSANAMKNYSENTRAGSTIVGIDVYCDGTTLSRSGSQSASILRVRFTNILGKTGKWHEVGISPRLLNGCQERTTTQKKTQRLHLFQRFFFMAMQDLIKASSSGFMYQGSIVFPRIVCTIADQPQERLFFGLKSAGSFQDCSCCVMKSAVPRRGEETPASVVEPTTEDDEYRIDSADDMEAQPREDSGGLQVNTLTQVRQNQLSGVRQLPRNVSYTVRCQLMIARSRSVPNARRSHSLERELKLSREHLKSVSALEYPPAMAAFHGLGTKPFLLYSSIGFDKLHVVDLGVFRSIPDLSFKRLAQYPYLTMSVSQQINIVNQRLLDLPRSARLPSISLFRYSANQKQSGMSGGIRRKFAPFLWVALMGVSESVKPDDDPLLQASLSLATASVHLTGTNESPSTASRTTEDIEDIQQACFAAGVALAEALHLKISTKLHRLMYHISDHLYSFGCIKRGGTDENEALHKETKVAYHATNYRPGQVSTQLLSSRLALYAGEENECTGIHCGPLECRLHSLEQDRVPPSPAFSGSEVGIQTFRITAARLRFSRTVEEAESSISDAKHSSSHQPLWRAIRNVTIVPKFDWRPNISHDPQMIYAGRNIYGQAIRRDAIQFMSRISSEPVLGIVQAFFENSTYSTLAVALVRVLEETTPEEGNEKVVFEHGNRRLKYKISGLGDVQMELVRVSDILRLAMVVPDTHDITVRFGLRTRINNIPDTLEERQLLRFFEVRAFQFTTLQDWVDVGET